MDNEILNVKQIAELLQMSQKTIRDLLNAGQLPGRKVGKSWRATKRSLMDFMDEKDTANVSETE